MLALPSQSTLLTFFYFLQFSATPKCYRHTVLGIPLCVTGECFSRLVLQSLGDLCHNRVIRNQQNLYPIFLLLQYSGLGSNTRMGFLRTNDLSEVKNGELNLDLKVVIKTVGWWFAN